MVRKNTNDGEGVMTDYAAPRQPAGVTAISRLADRLAAVTPPPSILELSNPAPLPRPSPAVAAALATTAAIAARADRNARRSRSITGLMVDGFVALCSFIPYALVALSLRLIMARVFFLDGQTRIDGPRLSHSLYGFDLAVILPMQVRPGTFADFLTHYAALPVPPMLAAYLVSYAEFVLPIMLLLGFGTRIAAIGLLIMTALIQIYVMPQALWSVHVYWAAILLALVSRGPGALSIDHFIRLASRR
jgi:putative oxidoreductase